MTERPAPERETSRRQLVHDELFTYAGYWSQDGVCRIRIFTAPDQVPVVVATELDDNRGTSVTNAGALPPSTLRGTFRSGLKPRKA